MPTNLCANVLLHSGESVAQECLNFIYTFQNGAVTVRVEAIFLLNRMAVSGFHSLGAADGANQHKQSRFR